MNIFLPQSIQAQCELEEIAAVNHQIIDPSSSNTAIGIVQDGLIGAYNMTDENMTIDWRTAMNLITCTNVEDYSFFKDKKNKDIKGMDLYSLIIPKNINSNNTSCKVVNGDIQGQINKSLLKAGAGKNLIQLIWDEYGPDKTKNFLNDAQWLCNVFNLHNGFSVGIGDTFIEDKFKKDISNYISSIDLKVDYEITKHENNPDFMENDIYEGQVRNHLGQIRDEVSKTVVNHIPDDNSFKIMLKSGSKGGATNLGQMMGSVGLQEVEGNLVKKKYNRRTLTYFHEDDDRSHSRGLIKSCYFDGLQYPEFVYHALTGRDGLIDTSIKTAETGYAQRRLVKSLEDILIKYDGTVRLANDNLIQIVYGDSGADTTKQYSYKINMIMMNDKDMKEKYIFNDNELKKVKNFSQNDNKKLLKNILSMRNKLRTSLLKSCMAYNVMKETFYFPVNFDRNINNQLNLKNNNDVLTDAGYIIEKLEEILLNENTSLILMSKKEQLNPKSLKFKDDRISKSLFRIALYDALSPKRVIFEYKFSKNQFDLIIDQIIRTFNKNIIEPGEMVGVIGAQSAGAGITQMTLNSFHSAGISALANTTQGVPRIKEILSVSKNPKTPQMIIYLNKNIRSSKEMSKKIGSNLKYTTLGHIRNRLDIFYDPDPYGENSIIKKDNVSKPFYSRKLSKTSCQVDVEGLPWLIRIEISRDKMIEKEVDLLDIKSKFCNWWERRFIDSKLMKKEEKKVLQKITSVAVMSNSDNDLQPVIHIRFNCKDVDKVKDPFETETLINFIDNIIDKFKLKGISDVNQINGILSKQVIKFGKYNFDELENDTVDTNLDYSLQKEEEYIIYTAGVNLIDIRYIYGIDLTRTISDNIIEVYETFGIEIARTVLLREILNAYSISGKSINYQHISILVDMMTTNGYLISIDRHGNNKADVDPLSKASFEKTVEHLLTAAVFGETDHMRGISSRVMAGLCIKAGTGFPDIKFNTKMIENSNVFDFYDEDNVLENEGFANDIMSNNKMGSDVFIPDF